MQGAPSGAGIAKWSRWSASRGNRAVELSCLVSEIVHDPKLLVPDLDPGFDAIQDMKAVSI